MIIHGLLFEQLTEVPFKIFFWNNTNRNYQWDFVKHHKKGTKCPLYLKDILRYILIAIKTIFQGLFIFFFACQFYFVEFDLNMKELNQLTIFFFLGVIILVCLKLTIKIC